MPSSMDERDAEAVNIGHLTARLDELELIVLALGNRVVEMGALAASPERGKDLNLRQPLPEAEMEELTTWVDWLVDRYASAGDWLRPCWRYHGFVVEELRALRSARLAAYDGSDPTSAPLIWHEAAERCRERIRRAISTGPGCTAVSHHDDQPMTDDGRWGSPATGSEAVRAPALSTRVQRRTPDRPSSRRQATASSSEAVIELKVGHELRR